MSDLREGLLQATRNGHFLDFIAQVELANRQTREAFVKELVSSHNEGLLNAITEFRKLENRGNSQHNFFPSRYILEKALPDIAGDIVEVVDCVIHLTKEAGNDMTAGALHKPYIDFCSSSPDTPESALELILSNTSHYYEILAPTIVAGTIIDMKSYTEKAIRLCKHPDSKIRRSSILALGNVDFSEHSSLPKKVLIQLEETADSEEDKSVLGVIIRTAFQTIKNDDSLTDQAIFLIDKIVKHERNHSLHAISEILAFCFDQIPEQQIKTLVDHLQHVNLKNRGTLKNIDFGLAKLIKNSHPQEAIGLLESLLTRDPKSIDISTFEHTIHELCTSSTGILDQIMTRWFITGNVTLCKAVHSIVHNCEKEKLYLKVSSKELQNYDEQYFVFIARKAVGYLYTEAACATSIVVSLLNISEENQTVNELTQLLFNPLLIGFPGEVGQYLESAKPGCTDLAKSAIVHVEKSAKQYFDDIKKLPPLNELQVPTPHREIYSRYLSDITSRSRKEAMNSSPFLSMVSKSTLLYGQKWIVYVEGPNGEQHRSENPLSVMGTTMEVPRLDLVNFYDLDYILRVFRGEQISQ